MKIVTIAEMQQAERDCARFGVSTHDLMENAGKAVAEQVRRIAGDLRKHDILVLVGPGNNGSDGLVAARHLFDWQTGRIMVYLCGARPPQDLNLAEVKKRGINIQAATDDTDLTIFNEWLSKATLVIDAIFGTGKSRPLAGVYAQILRSVRDAKTVRPSLRTVAVDLPSGVDADTGAADANTPYFDETVTLGLPKVGLFNFPAMEKTGKIQVVDIGIPDSVVESIRFELMTVAQVASELPKRPLVSHKGSFGKVLSITGSLDYSGAAYLACSASNRVGAGLTTLALARTLVPILAAKLTEVTYLPLPEAGPDLASLEALSLIRRALPQYNVLLAGCGIGQSQATADLILPLIFEERTALPLTVLDADALNILSSRQDWPRRFSGDAVLTPHPAEMARLTGKTIERIQTHRIEATREAADSWHKTVVLKGAYTVIAAPGGRVRISPFANPGLSSAGTGDVLAGSIAGFLAQGLKPFEAASCGVYVHGLAAEMVRDQMGDAGMLAGDLLPALPKAIRHLKEI